jgi:NADP-dependent 3-hydroxy acid dehydrogenase YdfG
MMSPATVATAVIDALKLPANATVENLEIMPTAGVL